MLTSSTTRTGGAAPSDPSRTRMLPGGGGAHEVAGVEGVRLVPAGTAAPHGWRTVVVAAEADAAGVHQPSWEVHFDPEVVGQLIRGGPLPDGVREQLAASGWEEVPLCRADGAPLASTYWVQRVDADTLERPKRPTGLCADVGL